MKVLLIIAAILALLLYLPVGVDAGYLGGQLVVKARVGPLTLTLLPKKPKKQKKRKEKKQPEEQAPAEAPPEEAPKEKKKLNLTRDEILDAAALLLRNLGKLRFRAGKLMIHFTSAFADPYQTAMVYGYVNAAVNALRLPMSKGADIQLATDFEQGRPSGEAYLSITIRVFYPARFALAVLFGGLKILLRRKKRIKREEKEQKLMIDAHAAGKET